MKIVQRGFVEKDKLEFGNQWRTRLTKAAEELVYLLDRGYAIKTASIFVGNHYMLSERQRLALTRIVSSKAQLIKRKEKERSVLPATVFIDGFNTIITLEVALSHSLLLKGMDGTLRDMAGLRGTYRVIDKTEPAMPSY